MNKKCLLVILSIIVIINGCKARQKEAVTNNESSKITTSDNSKSTNNNTNSKDTEVPTKDEVLTMQSIALKDMKKNDIERLKTTISTANLRLEWEFLFGDLESRLSDPESYYWNYLESTGEILIGYAYDDEALAKKDSLGLTEKNFEKEYGQQITTYNDYYANKIIELLSDLKSGINDKNLIQDFNNLIKYVSNAKENHDIEDIISIYRILHDMDYYLLRYGPEDVGKYVQDPSTINIYYGVLTCYN